MVIKIIVIVYKEVPWWEIFLSSSSFFKMVLTSWQAGVAVKVLWAQGRKHF
jgi:hypothetical protein